MAIIKVLFSISYFLGVIAFAISLVWLLISLIANLFAKLKKQKIKFSIKTPAILMLVSLALLFGPTIINTTLQTFGIGIN